jgi:hypothetical protein
MLHVDDRSVSNRRHREKGGRVREVANVIQEPRARRRKPEYRIVMRFVVLLVHPKVSAQPWGLQRLVTPIVVGSGP